MSRGIGRYLPGAKIAGFAMMVMLTDHGQGITEATDGIDEVIVPKALTDGRRGTAVVAGVQFFAGDFGTGATSGTWSFRIVKNGDETGGVVASGSLAYDATVKRLEVATVGAQGQGVELWAGDVLRLDVSGVPSGTLSGGAKGIRARLLLQVFGVSV